MALTSSGPGAFRASFNDKSAGPVSLRVTASDAAGGTIRETTLSAYKVS